MVNFGYNYFFVGVEFKFLDDFELDILLFFFEMFDELLMWFNVMILL